MTSFFHRSQFVNVSRITQDGWWLENTTEHVVKGTALSTDFTRNIYTPSREGMIARYDRDHDTWSEEHEDRTWQRYFDETGNPFIIGEPDGEYPAWAITEHPPEYDPHTQTVLYRDGAWKVYDILIGTPYFNEQGVQLLVSDYHFELPEKHSFDAPPTPRDGYGVKLVDGTWIELIDHTGKIAYSKDRDSGNDYEVGTPGPLPNTHTLKVPQTFDTWMNDIDGWQYDIKRHAPIKTEEEIAWRDAELVKVLNRIDQYEKDQRYPTTLRTSPIQTQAQFTLLLRDRKALSDYPESDGFPFSERPPLSGLAH
ncbi:MULTISPECIES: hypothetical protein [unclassified Vibrio]|uniref:hypothetical protein n=1 Tax=unclassified Vibrio TaxID=2614977 RepID=UPI001361B9F3|nr:MULTISPECIES: hypothetical protein [unclassified Vibrio]NAW58756.1 hypothetical protein [Vibrio sp. V36_P2S2PM302]NAX27189.1 hypothetical protein [Vibrio sp. V38_P2S17PM301]NAX32179.1 hypothetical protein [Vibrio sp. V37_P2S8PM304]